MSVRPGGPLPAAQAPSSGCVCALARVPPCASEPRKRRDASRGVSQVTIVFCCN